MTDPYSQEYWDERYASREQVWSGEPNPQLVAEAGSLQPGRALEVGSGEGADAIWLAARGWRVTATDVSEVALARAARRAAEAGDELAGRIVWEQHDIRTWTPPAAAYDLVTAHYLHPVPDLLGQVVRGLAAAVAPGGVLLYVGHDPSGPEAAEHPHREIMVIPAEAAALLDPAGWEVEVAETRPRARLDDAVLRARRRG